MRSRVEMLQWVALIVLIGTFCCTLLASLSIWGCITHTRHIMKTGQYFGLHPIKNHR